MSDSDPSAQPLDLASPPLQGRGSRGGACPSGETSRQDGRSHPNPSPGSEADPQDQREGLSSRKIPPPNPKRPPRRHEWTRARMAAFLGELRATQSVSRAARAVGMGRQSAYKLKTRMAGQPFAEAWDEVVEESRLTGPLALFIGPRACPLCGAAPLRTPGRR